MIKISFTIINIALALFLYYLNIWYEHEDIVIQNINKKYIKDTRKLQKIKKINNWLNQNVKKNASMIKTIKNSENADMNLVNFFDTYAKEYNFNIEKFIYKDRLAHFLDIKYSIARKDYNKLLKFMEQKYKNGYLFIKNFRVEKDLVSGELVVVQPFVSKIKKIKKESIEDVPQ